MDAVRGKAYVSRVNWLWIVARLIAAQSKNDSFAKDVRPILERRCQPCHFTGGKMYARLPFDKSETIVKLGTTKLFTRIRDEKDREVIRKYLATR